MTLRQRTNTARFNAQAGADARYIGFRTASGTHVVVQTNEGSANLRPRLDLIRHVPVGFDWGRAGSGQAQLALALLAHVSGDDAFALSPFTRQDLHMSQLHFPWDNVLVQPTSGTAKPVPTATNDHAAARKCRTAAGRSRETHRSEARRRQPHACAAADAKETAGS